MTDRLAEIEKDGHKAQMVGGTITILDTERFEWLIAEVKRYRQMEVNFNAILRQLDDRDAEVKRLSGIETECELRKQDQDYLLKTLGEQLARCDAQIMRANNAEAEVERLRLLNTAFGSLDKLEYDNGWYRMQLKRVWSFGNPERAHPVWECILGRYTDRGWVNDTQNQRCLAYGRGVADDPATAIFRAIEEAVDSDTGESAHPRDDIVVKPAVEPTSAEGMLDMPF